MRLLAMLAATLILAPTAAPAADPGSAAGTQRVAVARLAFEGTVPEAARDLFSQRLVQGLKAAELEVLSGDAVKAALAGDAALASCSAPACYPQVARKLDVSYLVLARLEARNKNYEIALELVNGRTGASLGANRERCVICGVEEAAEKMELAATSLRARLELVAHQPARFIVRSRPAGATAIIDGRPAGKTPLDVELPGGPHRLTLQAAGYDPVDHSFVVVSGVDETIDLELVPLPSRFPYRKLGYAAVAVGIVALAAGVWATAMDGEMKSCSQADKNSSTTGDQCPYLWDTRWFSPLLLAGGGALVATGGMWLWIARTGKGQHAAEAAGPASAAADGFVLGVSGRF